MILDIILGLAVAYLLLMPPSWDPAIKCKIKQKEESMPERVSRLIGEIEAGEFGDTDFSETSASTCWIKLPNNRKISARWYPSGMRNELQMRSRAGSWTELPCDRWSEMILQTIIDKTQAHHEAILSELLK